MAAAVVDHQGKSKRKEGEEEEEEEACHDHQSMMILSR